MHRVLVRTGDQFGRLTVTGEEPTIRFPSGQVQRRIRLRCACGADTTVILGSLRRGLVKSCGCLRAELSSVRNRTHGERASRAKEYEIWGNMIRRCEAPTHHAFKYYGGRGIKVCERWRGSYECFLADMGRRPSPHHSIDRIDNNGNYEPGNCRWATHSEQMKNRRPFAKRRQQ